MLVKGIYITLLVTLYRKSATKTPKAEKARDFKIQLNKVKPTPTFNIFLFGALSASQPKYNVNKVAKNIEVETRNPILSYSPITKKINNGHRTRATCSSPKPK